MSPGAPAAVVRNALERVARIVDALHDGEFDLAFAIARDLEADLVGVLDGWEGRERG